MGRQRKSRLCFQLLRHSIIALYILSSIAYLYAQEPLSVELKGIGLDMRKKELIDSWGYPSRREEKKKMEIWYYLNEDTPYPTDGVLVYFKKGKVKSWRVVDNIYQEMDIWQRGVGASP